MILCFVGATGSQRHLLLGTVVGTPVRTSDLLTHTQKKINSHYFETCIQLTISIQANAIKKG